MDFILGLGLALPVATSTGVSVVTGVAEGVSHQQKVNAEANNQSRDLKFHLRTRRAAEDVKTDEHARSSSTDTSASSRRAKSELDDGTIVLLNQKLYVEPCPSQSACPEAQATQAEKETAFYTSLTHHPFTGFYFPYPDDDRPLTRGLVSTITRDPPELNWIYVDKDTAEVKYSNRTGSRPHIVGDYDWTEEHGDNSRLTLLDFEGFCAVRDGTSTVKSTNVPKWSLYFDVDDDGLKKKCPGRKVVEVNLVRRLIDAQEVNKWGLGQQGNLGVKKVGSCHELRMLEE